ncbi:FecR family protein [Methylobacter sp.]|uniref:FecR family protein n=1 Tax=Methylobacter sp. TaxID=2051955 RepID=UPI002FDF028C
MSKVRTDAARWFARMQGAKTDHPDRERFKAWLVEHPSHAAEYAAFVELWKEFDSTAQCTALAEVMEKRQENHRQSRRRLLKYGAVSLLVAGTAGEAVYYRQLTPYWQLAWQTGIGQRSNQSLQDGSTLVLNAATDLEVAFSRAERKVHLLRGEVIFDVAKDAERPFIVNSDAARITVLGTRFAVSRLSDRIRVSVEHGSVRVETGPFWNRRHLQLEAGQVAEVLIANGEAGRPQNINRKAEDGFAFERGVIVFDRANLTEIAETLSRYRKEPVRVLPGRPGAVPRINAVVQSADVESFLRLLPNIAPVLVSHGQNEVRLSAL